MQTAEINESPQIAGNLANYYLSPKLIGFCLLCFRTRLVCLHFHPLPMLISGPQFCRSALLVLLVVALCTEIFYQHANLFLCMDNSATFPGTTTADNNASKVEEETLLSVDTNYEAPPKSQKSLYAIDDVPLIPQQFWFTNKCALEDDPNEMIRENVNGIVNMYREAWNNPTAPLHVLTDTECRVFISVGYPQLVDFFDKEPSGAIRGMYVASCLLSVSLKHIVPQVISVVLFYST